MTFKDICHLLAWFFQGSVMIPSNNSPEEWIIFPKERTKVGHAVTSFTIWLTPSGPTNIHCSVSQVPPSPLCGTSVWSPTREGILCFLIYLRSSSMCILPPSFGHKMTLEPFPNITKGYLYDEKEIKSMAYFNLTVILRIHETKTTFKMR